MDLDYADDIVLLFSNHESAQTTMDKLCEVIPRFGMHFAPSKCKVMLQDLPQLASPLKLRGEELSVVDHFTYLGSCVSNDGSITNEITSRISKARVAFASLRHLWRQKRIPLHLKGRVYKTTVRAVLLYGCETWPIRAEDLKRLKTFDNRCLRNIANINWRQRVRNEDLYKRIFGEDRYCSLHQQMQLCRTRWLGHVLRMTDSRLPRKVLFSIPDPSWRKAQGGQPMTWKRDLKQTTQKLGTAGAIRLPGWGVRERPNTWLETLHDMASNRSQWRTCCHFLADRLS